MKVNRFFKIEGYGMYLPANRVDSNTIEQMLNLPKGWIEDKVGVRYRHHTVDESNNYMAKEALDQALSLSHDEIKDIDILISAAATFDYVIPNRSSSILSEYETDNNIQAVDINTTCLSFVNALDYASMIFATNESVHKIAIVSSEVSSKGLSKNRPESYGLFGDGAAAVILYRDPSRKCGLITSKFQNFPAYADKTIIKGGGNKYHPSTYPYDEDLYSFEMHGSELLKASLQYLPKFIEGVLDDAKLGLSDLSWIVPHQASKSGFAILQKCVGEHHVLVAEDGLLRYGNCIAASIPMMLVEKLKSQEIKDGDIIMLLGTSAGMSIGSAILKI